jgi:putative DNA primase/helicase
VKKTDWSPLHGRNVVIWPDLDSPGAAYAADVRLLLNRCSITEIDPAACGLIDPGADCADWLDAHPGAKKADVEALPRVVIGGAPASAVAPDFDWMSRLELNTYSKPKSTSGNTYLILSNDDAWKDAIGWNERSLRVIARKDLPIGVKAGEELQERHASEIAVWFYDAWRMPNPKTSIILTEVGSAAQINTFDPVRDWLATLVWDKVPRVDSWLINAAGCDDDEAGYNVAVGSKFLIGAVARALRPGCKLDTLPVLCGDQNTLKSTTLKALCHDEAWFSDSFSAAEIGNKDATLKIHGPWIIEIPEIDAMGKREAAVVKAFVSSATDRFRHPFGRTTGDHPRRCAFSATVNPRSYLSDPTGNRRFWTVQFRRPNIDWVIANREQLWAEAVVRFKAGEAWWFSREMEVAAAKVAERHRIQDSWEVTIQSYLDGLPPGRAVCAADIQSDVLNLEPMHRNKNTDMRVAAILDGPRCRWVGVHEMRNGRQTTWYHPPIRAVDPVVEPVAPPPPKPEPVQTKIGADSGGFEW